jgi:hypothetical protein
MIYVHSLAGRNVYTKLDDFLNLKKMKNNNQKEGYEVLSKAVDEKYKSHTNNMLMKQTRNPLAPFSKCFINIIL